MASTDEAAAASGAGGGAGSDILPSQTLYINNLNDKVKKAALKKALYAAFAPYGRILDIVALKTTRLRGQAWIVFADVASATTALRAMKDFPFYDKPMRIQFAKTQSNAVAKLEGKFVPRAKRKAEEPPASQPPAKRAAVGPAAAPAAPAVPHVTLPSRVLLVQGLPAGTTGEAIRGLFGQYAGLTDVRPVVERGLAFVEFDSEAAAAPALHGLNNFRLAPDAVLSVTYTRQ